MPSWAFPDPIPPRPGPGPIPEPPRTGPGYRAFLDPLDKYGHTWSGVSNIHKTPSGPGGVHEPCTRHEAEQVLFREQQRLHGIRAAQIAQDKQRQSVQSGLPKLPLNRIRPLLTPELQAQQRAQCDFITRVGDLAPNVQRRKLTDEEMYKEQFRCWHRWLYRKIMSGNPIDAEELLGEFLLRHNLSPPRGKLDSLWRALLKIKCLADYPELKYIQ